MNPATTDCRLAGRDLQGQRQLLPGRHLRPCGRPAAAAPSAAQRERVRGVGAGRQHLDPPGRHLRRHHGAPLRERHARSPAWPRPAAIASSTNPLSIGSDSIYGQYFNGLIDDVRVYNTALTAAQIQTDMTTPVAPPAPDTTPPSAPGTLTATAISSGRVDLSWGAASDNVGVTGYHIERCQGAGCTTFAEIATTAGTHHATATPAPPPAPATATASAPTTPPPTSAPTPTPPPRQPPVPTRRRRRRRAR